MRVAVSESATFPNCPRTNGCHASTQSLVGMLPDKGAITVSFPQGKSVTPWRVGLFADPLNIKVTSNEEGSFE